MARDCQREVRSCGLAGDIDVVQRTAELAFRGQDTREATKDAQIGILEHVFCRQRSLPRFFHPPWTKVTLRGDHAGRYGIREARLERRRVSQSDRMHQEMMNQELVHGLVRITGQEIEFSITGDELIHNHGDVAKLLSRLGLPFAFWRDVNRHAFQLNPANMPRFAKKAQQAHFAGEFADIEQWRDVGAAAMTKDQILSADENAMQDRDVQLAKFRIAIKTAAQHIDGARAHDRRDMRNQDRQSDAQNHEQYPRGREQTYPGWLA